MLRFIDFAPRPLGEPGFFQDATYETFDQVVANADAWLSNSGVKPIQLETIVLPNVYEAGGEQGTLHGALHTAGERRSHWHQVLRVWYRA